jgi:hypothetical protein
MQIKDGTPNFNPPEIGFTSSSLLVYGRGETADEARTKIELDFVDWAIRTPEIVGRSALERTDRLSLLLSRAVAYHELNPGLEIPIGLSAVHLSAVEEAAEQAKLHARDRVTSDGPLNLSATLHEMNLANGVISAIAEYLD